MDEKELQPISDSESSDEELQVESKIEKPKRKYVRKPLTEEQKQKNKERMILVRASKKNSKSAPKPEPKSAPKPEPKPVPKPEPKPAPEPAPKPEPEMPNFANNTDMYLRILEKALDRNKEPAPKKERKPRAKKTEPEPKPAPKPKKENVATKIKPMVFV